MNAAGQALPPVDENASLIIPPPPIAYMSDNWPQLAVTRGPFEAQLALGDKAEGSGVHAAAMTAMDLGDVDAGAWGEDDDLIIDEDGQIVKGDIGATMEEGDEGEGGGWDEDDLELPPELVGDTSPAAAAAEDMYTTLRVTHSPLYTQVCRANAWSAVVHALGERVPSGRRSHCRRSIR